jgi:hypothetical protein
MPLRSNDVGGHIPRLSNSFRILGILFTPDAKRSKASSSVASSGILLWHTQPSSVATAISASRRDDDGEDFAGVFTNRFFGVGRMDGVSSLAAVVGIGVSLTAEGLLERRGLDRPVDRDNRAEECGTNTPLIMHSLPYRSHETIIRPMMLSMYAISSGLNACCMM